MNIVRGRTRRGKRRYRIEKKTKTWQRYFTLMFIGAGLCIGVTTGLIGGRGYAKADTLKGADPSLRILEACKWRNDRMLLGSLGKTGSPKLEDCFDSKDGGDAHTRKQVSELTTGFPIEDMAPAIAEYDRPIAGLIVGIAKKESNWGKRTPKLRGEECFNYWGYRGPGTRGLTEDGYGCFEKPEDAVRAIGDRLVELAALRSTQPERMIVWKCGSSCVTHSPESVRKWISDVDHYYQKFAVASVPSRQ